VHVEDLGYNSDLGWPVRIFEAKQEHPGMRTILPIDQFPEVLVHRDDEAIAKKTTRVFRMLEFKIPLRDTGMCA